MLNDICGSVVECDDLDSFEKEIIRICTTKQYIKAQLDELIKEYDENERFKEYLELYERVITTGTKGD